ncbi:hypothetical protein PUN28_005102 [Cardiocondyla obscurior]|uniref:Uncharacterized protein n=1 Tax=Cardiocondyla obscurior TaxID=286306 RepID=A0AAW2GJ49_9HYME
MDAYSSGASLLPILRRALAPPVFCTCANRVCTYAVRMPAINRPVNAVSFPLDFTRIFSHIKAEMKLRSQADWRSLCADRSEIADTREDSVTRTYYTYTSACYRMPVSDASSRICKHARYVRANTDTSLRIVFARWWPRGCHV